MWLMIKDDQYRDNPPNTDFHSGQSSNLSLLPVYNSNRPEVHAVVSEMRSVIDSYPNRVLIGEIYLPATELMAYYGQHLDGADLPFNFLLLQCPWTAQAIAEVITEYMGALPQGAWPNWVLGNHDNARIATRVGPQQARVAAMLLLTLPGTVTMYYGEELAMTNGTIPPAAVKDPAEKRQPGIGMGRDPERTPMLWDASPLAGFTEGAPWLPLNADHVERNVEAQQQNESSILNLYRELIGLRRVHTGLAGTGIQKVSAQGNLLRYERAGATERILVLLNLGSVPAHTSAEAGTILLSTAPGRQGQRLEQTVTLEGGEGILITVNVAR
jgi:alpha-glucosidase